MTDAAVPAQVLWIAIPAISSALYGLLFFLRRQELGPVSRSFSAFLIAAAIWSLGSMLLHANLSVFPPVWMARLVMFGNTGMPVAIFAFTVHFLSLPRQRPLIPLGVFAYGIVSLINLAGYIVVSADVNNGLVENQYGWGMIGVSVLWSASFYPAIFLLVRELRRSKDPTFRNRLKYLLITFVLLLAASLVNLTPLAAYPIDHLLAGLTAILISVSTSRYQLLEIRQVVRRLMALVLVVAFYVAAVGGALFVLAGLDRQLLPLASILAAAATAAPILAYRPLRQGLADIIDRVFFPEQYNVHALIYAISRVSNRLRPPRALGADILREFTRAFRCDDADLFIKLAPEADYECVAGAHLRPGQPEVTFRSDSPLVSELAVYGRAMHVDRLQELPRLRALWIGEWKALRSLRATVLVPVRAEEDLIAFIALGAKRNGEPYARRELQETLPLLANHVSIALLNSRLYVQEQTRADQLARANAELRDAQTALSASAERIHREAARAEALLRIADRLNAQLDLATILSAVCEETARAVDAPAVSVSLSSDRGDVLAGTACLGMPPDYNRRARPLSRADYDRYVQAGGAAVLTAQAPGWGDLPDAALYEEMGVVAVVMVSMQREGQLVGSLNVFTRDPAHHCDDDELALLKGVAAQAAQAIVNARLFADAQRRLRNMEALHRVDNAINGGAALPVTLGVVLDQVARELGVDAADVLVLNARGAGTGNEALPVDLEGRRSLDCVAGLGFRAAARAVADGDCARRIARERSMVLIPDLTATPTAPGAPLLEGEGFVAYAGVPLVAKNEVKGVLEIFHRAPIDPDGEWMAVLDALAVQAAIAIDNHELFADLQRSNLELSTAYESTLEGWARALELRDHETEGHTRRVTEWIVRLAHHMGIGDEDMVHFRRGAILHDIGKMAVPDGILLKPGPLDAEEWAIMRQHPVYARQLLTAVPFLSRALDIPYSHHEKWDGTGYPHGLKGEEIPLSARIFAVVDVWDALRSDRPYHVAWTDECARAYLVAQSGRHFDPRVVDAFLRVLADEPAASSGPAASGGCAASSGCAASGGRDAQRVAG